MMEEVYVYPSIVRYKFVIFLLQKNVIIIKEMLCL